MPEPPAAVGLPPIVALLEHGPPDLFAPALALRFLVTTTVLVAEQLLASVAVTV